MKKLYMRIVTALITAAFLMMPLEASAIEGTMGYEGGISTESKIKKDEYQYSEMCFLTGKPILLTGTLAIKKTDKNGVINATYTYKLANAASNVTMNRVVLYTTTKETKPNGQKTETTKLSRDPTEVITIGGTTYRLTKASFTRSMLTDPKAAINYHAGEFSEEKVYSVGTGANNANTVTVTLSGRLYAYDQHWSSTQTQKINVLVEADIKSGTNPVKWGGAAEIVVSSASRHKIQYSENEPTQISFEGGYVKSSWTEATLDYTARFPEFDKNGIPTDVLKTYNDTQTLSAAPEMSRLMVPDLKQLNGFWSQEPISILFGLEVIPGTGASYKAETFVTRREFVAMLVRSLKDVPQDANVRTVTTPVRRTSSKTPEVSPFKDVNPGDLYYEEIKMAFQKGITHGDGNANFNPNVYITQAEAVKMIVSALGLENLAPYPASTTPFTDNDLIPAYARNAASVASTLGLVSPDERGGFNPSSRLTNEKTANMLYGLISYMGNELIKDYRDRMMEF